MTAGATNMPWGAAWLGWGGEWREGGRERRESQQGQYISRHLNGWSNSVHQCLDKRDAPLHPAINKIYTTSNSKRTDTATLYNVHNA